MNKSLYSLILSDEVISEIDRLAYKSGTNRSNMINQILADYVSYTTPEKRMSQIFNSLESIMSPNDSFRTLLGNSLSVMNFRSSLDFKYNPSVRYTVELYRSYTNEVGELKVSLRTQNSSLILYMIQFYKLWAGIEASYMNDCEYTLENEKLIRKLKLHSTKNISSEELGEAIAEYINAFDKALKAYFYNISDSYASKEEVSKIFGEYYNNTKIIL